jgi:YgiT-type zinc finger domain-containing protein
MKCAICKSGMTRPGTTTVTLERGGSILVMKEVPAEICANCSEDYVAASTAHDIMILAGKFAQTGAQVDIRRYVRNW